jgi:hypothetical protein
MEFTKEQSCSVMERKGVTKEEHQRILKRFANAIEESNVLLRAAGMRDKDSQAQIQTKKNVQSSKSKSKRKNSNRYNPPNGHHLKFDCNTR